MKKLIWLDDTRNPFDNNGSWLVFSPIEQPYCVVWCKKYDDFLEEIVYNGMPDAICFDHDLGMEIVLEARSFGMSKRKSRELKKEAKSGYDCAKWLVDYCMEKSLNLPKWNIQSQNPVGAENIRGILLNFEKFKNINQNEL